MSTFFTHSSPISDVYPGSGYAVEFSFYSASGSLRYGLSLTSSGGGLTYWQNSFEAIQGKWAEFRKTLAVQSAGVAPVLCFFDLDATYMGTLAFVDDVRFTDNKDMIALGVLQIFPEWNLKKYNVNNKTDHRTKGGKLYSYKWGSYTKIEAELNYVQNSKAAIINSWWSTDALIYFKVYSGGTWDVTTGYLMNDNAPFAERSEPYDQYKNGLIELESF